MTRDSKSNGLRPGDAKPGQLKRALGLPMLTCYGVGTIVGGGFYALTGKVAGQAGMLLPFSLLAASIIAMFSAFSFAELSARLPKSAGEAHYVETAFGRRWLSAVIGWMVIATGVVSAATLAVAFSEFLQRFVTSPPWIGITAVVLLLGLVTAWGIRESAWLVLSITVVEVGGLIFVLAAGGHHLGDVPARWNELLPGISPANWSGILLGAYLAFYSFVGFEDMVNIAEEVKQPRRNLPRAILLSLLVTTLLYVLVGLVTVLSAPREALVEAESPLSLVLGDWRLAGDAVAVIGMLAGVNGALVQMVMAARVLYGLAGKQQAPSIFARVHPFTSTPLQATAVVTGIVLVLSLGFPLTGLATATSTILLVVYAIVNLSLWRIKGQTPQSPAGAPNYPRWLSLAGFVVCGAFLLFRLATLWWNPMG